MLHLSSYIAAAAQEGWTIQCVMTASAARLMPPSTLSAFATTYTDTAYHDLRVPHINLASWATVVVILPATANMIGKIAAGIADDLATSIVISTVVPIAIFPNMESGMWANPIVQRNVRAVQDAGYHVWTKLRTMFSVGLNAYEEGIGVPLPLQFITVINDLVTT